MDDQVLQGFISYFAEEGKLNLNDSRLFEVFSTSLILRKYHQVIIQDVDDFLTGMQQDGGIDAIAILVTVWKYYL